MPRAVPQGRFQQLSQPGSALPTIEYSGFSLHLNHPEFSGVHVGGEGGYYGDDNITTLYVAISQSHTQFT